MSLIQGDVAPLLKLKDIDDRVFSTEDYLGTIRIFTFADRNSSGRLTEWLSDANIAIKKAHPAAKLTYINFADVSIVPKLVRNVVRPVLRAINSRSQQQLQQVYEEAGIVDGLDDIHFHLIPDWRGDYLEQFGIDDAGNYHIWIEQDGKIVDTLHEPTDDIAEKFVACVGNCCEASGR